MSVSPSMYSVIRHTDKHIHDWGFSVLNKKIKN